MRQSIYDAAGLESTRSTFEYDNYAGTDSYHAPLKDWPTLTGIGISGLDPSFTSSYSYRGNLTATTRYLLNNNQITGSITGYTQYDLAGSVVKSIDARSTPENIIASTFSYDDCFGFPDGNARGNSVPEGLTTPSLRTYAFPTLTTNALGHKVFTQFDYYLARPVDVEDANGTVYSGFYDDVFDRPTKLIKAANRDTSFQSQTLFNYDDIGRNVTTTSDLRLFTDQVLKEQLFYDGLGRTVETRQYEGGSNYIAARKVYDALGRVSESSNPFRPWKNEVAIWNISTFDGLGRAESLRTADGATATVSYSGNEVIDRSDRQEKKNCKRCAWPADQGV